MADETKFIFRLREAVFVPSVHAAVPAGTICFHLLPQRSVKQQMKRPGSTDRRQPGEQPNYLMMTLFLLHLVATPVCGCPLVQLQAGGRVAAAAGEDAFQRAGDVALAAFEQKTAWSPGLGEQGIPGPHPAKAIFSLAPSEKRALPSEDTSEAGSCFQTGQG